MHFKTPHNKIKCGLSTKQSNFNGSKVSHLLTVRAERANLPPLWWAKFLQAQCKIYLFHKTFTFYYSSLSFLLWKFSFWYFNMIVANKLRGVVAWSLKSGLVLPTQISVWSSQKARKFRQIQPTTKVRILCFDCPLRIKINDSCFSLCFQWNI